MKDEVQLDQACGVLINYAVIRRNAADGMLSLHRLVQAVLKDRMTEQQRQQWAERAVRAVEAARSKTPDSDAEQYLPHAYVCAGLIKEREITSEEAARLLEGRPRWLMHMSGIRKLHHCTGERMTPSRDSMARMTRRVCICS